MTDNQGRLTSFRWRSAAHRRNFSRCRGCKLTVAQAARLWHFDSALCTAVLSRLVEQRFLIETRNHSFARA